MTTYESTKDLINPRRVTLDFEESKQDLYNFTSPNYWEFLQKKVQDSDNVLRQYREANYKDYAKELGRKLAESRIEEQILLEEIKDHNRELGRERYAPFRKNQSQQNLDRSYRAKVVGRDDQPVSPELRYDSVLVPINEAAGSKLDFNTLVPAHQMPSMSSQQQDQSPYLNSKDSLPLLKTNLEESKDTTINMRKW